MNYLKAVFWDYPRLSVPEELENFIRLNRANDRVYRWLLKRFLEHARAVDALKYFSLGEISSSLSGLRLSPYAQKKWKRIIEVYGRYQRR